MPTSSPLKKYTESGIAPPLNVAGILILAIASAFVLGFVYNSLIRLLSFVYVNVFILVAFGYILAYLSRGLNIIFKIRSKKKSMFITAAIAVLAIYIQWVCFIYIFSVENLTPIEDFGAILQIASRPDLLVEALFEINQYGTWEIGETPINSTILWCIWLGEALLMLAIPLRLYVQFDVLPFSEVDNRWYKKRKIDQDFEYILLRRNFLESFYKNPTESLQSLGKPDFSKYSRVYIYSDKNRRSFLIEIENVTVDYKVNKDYSEVLPASHVSFEEIKKLETSFKIV